MLDHERDRVLPGEGAGAAEHGLAAVVPARGVEAEVDQALRVRPIGAPARERAGELPHVGLRVGAAVRAEREQLHQLARVVLVDRAAAVVEAVEEDEHRPVDRDRARHRAEGAEAVRPEDVRLLEHHLVGADGVVARRPPVVEDEREPLDELVARADHAVEPVEVVAVPGVQRRERLAVDGRLGARHRRGARRAGEREDRGVEAHRDQPVDVTRARAEAGAPQQPLGLARAEGALVDGDRGGLAPARGRRRRDGGRRAGRGVRGGGQRGGGMRARRLRLLALLLRPALAPRALLGGRVRARLRRYAVLLLPLSLRRGRAARLGLAALALALRGGGAGGAHAPLSPSCSRRWTPARGGASPSRRRRA